MLNWNQFCSKWVDRIFFQIGLFETAWIGMYLSWKTFELNSECGNVFMHIFVMLLLLLFCCPDTVSNLEVSIFKSHSWKCAFVLARNDIFEMLIKSDVPYTVILFFYVFFCIANTRALCFFSLSSIVDHKMRIVLPNIIGGLSRLHLFGLCRNGYFHLTISETNSHYEISRTHTQHFDYISFVGFSLHIKQKSPNNTLIWIWIVSVQLVICLLC